jgi:LAO/AO transport system kinase
LTPSQLKDRILSGDVRALARAATLVENKPSEGRELLRLLLPSTGQALTVGITGPPGAGKSTLANALTAYLRKLGKKIGILAVDPSSAVSQGAILGDRIRMQEHHADPQVFIRSVATRGQLGGLAACTFDHVLLLDSAGFDVILIETVGVGQDEIDVSAMADVTLVVLVPGQGDDVQAIKAGLMEIADIFVINKADLPGVERIEQEIRAMQGLAEPGERERAALVRRVVATESKGLEELTADILKTKPGAKRNSQFWTDCIRRLAAQENVVIDHLGIAVSSIDGALAFYQNQLGILLAQRETVAEENVHVAMFAAGSGERPPRIELLEPASPASPLSRFIEKRGPGLHHLALRVSDLGATVERLRSAGAHILNEPRAGAGGHIYVFVHPQSTGGVLLELIQD